LISGIAFAVSYAIALLLIIVPASQTLLTSVRRYFLAVHFNDIHKILPYISNTGSRPPESSWFTFLLTITSILSTPSVKCVVE
jgi:hypothetical protein